MGTPADKCEEGNREEGLVIYMGPLDGMFTRMGMGISILGLHFFYTHYA